MFGKCNDWNRFAIKYKAMNFVQISMSKKIFLKMSFSLNGYEKTLLFNIQTIQGGVRHYNSMF